jgi:hypothetical protein
VTATRARAVDRIEHLITTLVQTAPELEPALADELVRHLLELDSSIEHPQPLARSIARVIELVAVRRVAPGIALPPLAMACATLAAGVRGELDDRALEAARYEIDTLLPLPRAPIAIAAPDVPVSALRKRDR